MYIPILFKTQPVSTALEDSSSDTYPAHWSVDYTKIPLTPYQEANAAFPDAIASSPVKAGGSDSSTDGDLVLEFPAPKITKDKVESSELTI